MHIVGKAPEITGDADAAKLMKELWDQTPQRIKNIYESKLKIATKRIQKKLKLVSNDELLDMGPIAAMEHLQTLKTAQDEIEKERNRLFNFYILK